MMADGKSYKRTDGAKTTNASMAQMTMLSNIRAKSKF